MEIILFRPEIQNVPIFIGAQNPVSAAFPRLANCFRTRRRKACFILHDGGRHFATLLEILEAWNTIVNNQWWLCSLRIIVKHGLNLINDKTGYHFEVLELPSICLRCRGMNLNRIRIIFKNSWDFCSWTGNFITSHISRLFSSGMLLVPIAFRIHKLM